MLFRSNRIISFSIQVNGLDRRITFNPRMNGGSSYLSQDPDEQAALVRNEMCGRVYEPVNKEEAEALLASVKAEGAVKPKGKPKDATEDKAENPAPKKKAKKAEATTEEAEANAEACEKTCEAESWQEAADYLSSQFGVSEEQLDTPDKILEQGKRLGVTFSNL